MHTKYQEFGVILAFFLLHLKRNSLIYFSVNSCGSLYNMHYLSTFVNALSSTVVLQICSSGVWDKAWHEGGIPTCSFKKKVYALSFGSVLLFFYLNFYLYWYMFVAHNGYILHRELVNVHNIWILFSSLSHLCFSLPFISWSPSLFQKIYLPISSYLSFILLWVYILGFPYERNHAIFKLECLI